MRHELSQFHLLASRHFTLTPCPSVHAQSAWLLEGFECDTLELGNFPILLKSGDI